MNPFPKNITDLITIKRERKLDQKKVEEFIISSLSEYKKIQEKKADYTEKFKKGVKTVLEIASRRINNLENKAVLLMPYFVLVQYLRCSVRETLSETIDQFNSQSENPKTVEETFYSKDYHRRGANGALIESSDFCIKNQDDLKSFQVKSRIIGKCLPTQNLRTDNIFNLLDSLIATDHFDFKTVAKQLFREPSSLVGDLLGFLTVELVSELKLDTSYAKWIYWQATKLRESMTKYQYLIPTVDININEADRLIIKNEIYLSNISTDTA